MARMSDQSRLSTTCSWSLSFPWLGNSVDHGAFALLGDNDMVEMTWYLVSALVAIRAVANAKASLHARLPRPTIDSVHASDMAFTGRAW